MIKLTAKDYRVIGIVLIVAAVSLAISVKYFWRAFPEASIDFHIDRNGSQDVAAQFLKNQGIALDGYRHAAIFDYDDTQKLYLERTQGLEQMNQLTGAGGPIHIWRWANRWFKPLEKEEYQVAVTPEGQIAGYRHELAETAPGASLASGDARQIAETFLTKTLGRNLSEFDFLDAAEEKRPARIDHTFTWIQKQVHLGEADYRMEVTIAGNQAIGFRQYVHVPEQWLRDYQQLRSRNDSAQLVDEVFWILLSVAMIVVLIRRVRLRDVPVRLALGFGLTATVLVFLDQLNSFSLSQFGYATTDTYSSFVTGYLLRAILSAFGMGLAIFMIVASSEPVYRERFPGLPSIGRTFSWQGLRSKSFFIANVVGIGMTFFFFAYQTLFYLFANHLGAWAPSDVPFSDELNTSIPWVAVLFGGFAPAVLEEMQFRTFAIPFLQRLVKFWPIAIVLAAFNWGFLHAAYPNQPFFIRGVEVGLGGIIVGILMMRFGVIATMIWHYSVDAMYTAFILLRSSNVYLRTSGAMTGGIMLIPLTIALIAYWRSGTFSDDSALSNAAVGTQRNPPVVEVVDAVQNVPYAPLGARKVFVGGALVIAFVFLSWSPVHEFGENVNVAVSREQAIDSATHYLTQKKLPLDGYRSAAWLNENVDPEAVKYLYEHLSVEASDRVYKQATHLLLWQVRFFRPLQKEEYSVFVDASSGEVFSFRHLLDENAPGPSLAADQAQAIAETAMRERGYKLEEFDLQNTQAQKRKAREDYAFTWQAKAGDSRNVADAKFRVEVDIAGDRVVALGRSFKLPEDWTRRRDASGFGNVALSAAGILFLALVLGSIARLFVARLRSGAIAWTRSAGVAVFVAVLAALSEATQLPVVDRAYDTSIPLSTFHLFMAISYFVTPLAAGLAAWLMIALCTSLFPEAWDVLRRPARSLWSRDAVLAIILSVAATAGMAQVASFLTNWLHVWAPPSMDLAPSALDASPAGLSVFLHGMIYAFGSAALTAIVLYVARDHWQRRTVWLWLSLALLVVALGPSDAHSFAEYATGWLIHFLPFAAGAVVIVEFFGNNVSSYLGAALCTEVFSPLSGMLSQPLPLYRSQALLSLALIAAVLLWLLKPIRLTGSASIRSASID